MSKKDYDIKYEKRNIKRVALSLNRNTDRDIILFLESKTNVQGFIKTLIREHIKKETE